MGWYARLVFARLMHAACGMPLVRAQRARIVPLASGRVVELGVGSGLNLPLYDPARVMRLVGVEPSVVTGYLAGAPRFAGYPYRGVYSPA